MPSIPVTVSLGEIPTLLVPAPPMLMFVVSDPIERLLLGPFNAAAVSAFADSVPPRVPLPEMLKLLVACGLVVF